MRSPLRYPGGKYFLTSYMEKIISLNSLTGAHFFEPYAGGAASSLHLLHKKLITKSTLIEKDPLVYAFWKEVKFNGDRLCDKIHEQKIDIDSWKDFQKYQCKNVLKKYKRLDVALACIFLNRTNFSGILEAGPIGGMKQNSKYKIDCRFNKKRIIGIIKEITKFKNQITVVHSDAISYLKRNLLRINSNLSVVYIDPPYFSQGKRLYRYFYQNKQHEKLTKFIRKQSFPWVVSYDNHPFILNLFKGQKIIPISMNSTVKKSRKTNELIISNIILPDDKNDNKYDTELKKQRHVS